MIRRMGKGTELSKRLHRTRQHVKVLGTFREAPKATGVEFRVRVWSQERLGVSNARGGLSLKATG